MPFGDKFERPRGTYGCALARGEKQNRVVCEYRKVQQIGLACADIEQPGGADKIEPLVEIRQSEYWFCHRCFEIE